METHTPEGMIQGAASLTLSALASFLCVQKGQGPEYSAWVPSEQFWAYHLLWLESWRKPRVQVILPPQVSRLTHLQCFVFLIPPFPLHPHFIHTPDLDPTSQCTKLNVAMMSHRYFLQKCLRIYKVSTTISQGTFKVDPGDPLITLPPARQGTTL